MTRQEITDLILRLSNDGLKLREIAEYLKEKNVATFSGKGEWSTGSISRILKKERKNSMDIEVNGGGFSIKQQGKSFGVWLGQDFICACQSENKAKQVIKDSRTAKEVNRLNEKIAAYETEIKRLNDSIERKQGVIDKLTTENIDIRQTKIEDIEIEKLKQENRELKMEIESKQARADGISLETVTELVKNMLIPLQTDLENVKQKVAVALTSDRKSKRPVYVEGWNVQKSGKYFKAYRKINGVMRGIHIGPDYNEQLARKKIKARLEKVGREWGLADY